jgi:ATP-dependent Clp protease ATP-binding subunit ClpC
LRRALQKFIEDPLSEALIQGTLPRPSELEVYLGDSGIYCRPIAGELAGELEAQPVGAPGEGQASAPVAGISLYPF